MIYSFSLSVGCGSVFEITFLANLFFDWGEGTCEEYWSLHKTVNRKLKASFSASFGWCWEWPHQSWLLTLGWSLCQFNHLPSSLVKQSPRTRWMSQRLQWHGKGFTFKCTWWFLNIFSFLLWSQFVSDHHSWVCSFHLVQEEGRCQAVSAGNWSAEEVYSLSVPSSCEREINPRTQSDRHSHRDVRGPVPSQPVAHRPA